MKRALVTGAAGQDGWYLVDLLLKHGYEVFAQSRSINARNLDLENVHWKIGSLTDESFLNKLLFELMPDEIYNLAAVSRPVVSWDIPIETTLLNAVVPLRICEFIRREKPSCRFFQASSSEIFGDASPTQQDEQTRPNPGTPYGISKAYAHQIVGAYREQHGLHISCGILFNHESPRRPLSFVSQKIVHAAAACGLGLSETRELDERGMPILRGGKLYLGDVSIRRDFGFAGDFVEAMYLILQSQTASDYVIGTGTAHSIADFCKTAFEVVGVDWTKVVEVDRSLLRKIDSHFTQADPTKLKSQLGWSPKVNFGELVSMMVQARIKLLKLQFDHSDS